MNENVLPWPGSLVIQISPPNASTSCREIASPRPVPPCRRVVEGSAWVNASKSRSRASGSMPTPVSETSIRSTTSVAVASWSAAWTTTSPLVGELDGVRAEVGDDLAEPARVAAQLLGYVGVAGDHQLQALVVRRTG